MNRLLGSMMVFGLVYASCAAQPAPPRAMPCEEARAQKDSITLRLLKVDAWVAEAVALDPVKQKDRIVELHRLAYHTLDTALRQPGIVKYDLPCLLSHVNVVHSPDLRYWILQWDENLDNPNGRMVTCKHLRDMLGRPPLCLRTFTEKYFTDERTILRIDTIAGSNYLVEHRYKVMNVRWEDQPYYWHGIDMQQVTPCTGYEYGEITQSGRTVGQAAPPHKLRLEYDRTTRTVTIEYVVDEYNLYGVVDQYYLYALGNHLEQFQEPQLLVDTVGYAVDEEEYYDEEDGAYYYEDDEMAAEYTGEAAPVAEPDYSVFIGKTVTETWKFNGKEFELVDVAVED